MPKQKLQIVILEKGFAESGSISSNIFITAKPRNSVQEILESLAKAIIEGMHESEPHIYKDCCKKSKEEGQTFCSKCGSRLQAEELDLEDYEQIVMAYLDGVVDGTAEVYETMGDEGWYTFGEVIHSGANPFDNDPTIIYITEYGETLIAAAHTKELQPKENRGKNNCDYRVTVDDKVKIIGGDAKNLKIFKEV